MNALTIWLLVLVWIVAFVELLTLLGGFGEDLRKASLRRFEALARAYARAREAISRLRPRRSAEAFDRGGRDHDHEA